MPGEDIQSWSITAATNSAADTLINWAEGQPRASVNNSARSMMAAHAKDLNLKNGSIITAGTANAQTFISGVGYTSVPTGLRVRLKIGPALTNTAAVTLNMDGIGAVAVKDQANANPLPGALTAGGYAELLYNGTNWILLDATPFIAAVQNNKPAFFGYLVSDQPGWPATTYIPGLFRTELFDVGSYFNAANGVWTPPAGKVMITLQCYFSNMQVSPDSYGYAIVYKNGVQYRQVIGVTVLGVMGVNLTFVDTASGTDYYEGYFWLSAVQLPAGATLDSNVSNTFFCGHQI